MTRRLPVVLVILGVLVLLTSVISAVVVRSTDTATVTLPERPEASVVVTESGVLSAVDPTVTVRASAEADEPVVLAIGRTSEVEAWLDDAEHARVVGLSSWEELTVEVSTGDPDHATDPTDESTDEPTDEPAPETTGLPNPAGSDLWVAEADGTGEAELSWTDRPGRWSLVAATDGTAPAPVVELEWGRSVGTPWLVPGIVVGVLLLLAGAAMLVLDALARREQRQRDAARERQALEWTPTGAGPVASVHDTDPGTGERLSRRQIRELERAVADAERRRRRGEVVEPVPQAVETDDEVPAAPGDSPTGTGTATDARAEAGDGDAGADTDTDTGTGAGDSDSDEGAVEDGRRDAEPPVAASPSEPDTAPSAQSPAGEPEQSRAPDQSGEPDQSGAPESGAPGRASGPVPAAAAQSGPEADPTGGSLPAPATAATPEEIPADGSTPRRPAPVAGPTGLRGWWARRRGAADRPHDEAPTTTPASSGPPVPDRAAEAPAPTPDSPEETPSWRSVWGFGSSTPRPDEQPNDGPAGDDLTDDPTDDHGKEAR